MNLNFIFINLKEWIFYLCYSILRMVFQTTYRRSLITFYVYHTELWETLLTTHCYQGIEKGRISLVLQMLALGSQKCIYMINCMSLRKSVSALNFISLYLQWELQPLCRADLKLKQYWDNKVIGLKQSYYEKWKNSRRWTTQSREIWERKNKVQCSILFYEVTELESQKERCLSPLLEGGCRYLEKIRDCRLLSCVKWVPELAI